MPKVHVETGSVGGVKLLVDGTAEGILTSIYLSWPQANKLQAELRKLCVDAGITLAGGIGS